MEQLYRVIYDPSGVSFEVPPDRAADLVLNKGWSNTPTTKKTATKKTSYKKAKAADELAADTEEVTEDDLSSLSSE